MKDAHKELLELYLQDSCTEEQLEAVYDLVKTDHHFRKELAEAGRIQGLLAASESDETEELSQSILKALSDMDQDEFELGVFKKIDESYSAVSMKRWAFFLWTAVAAQVFFLFYINFAKINETSGPQTLASLYSESGKAKLIRNGKEMKVTAEMRLMDGDEILVERKGDVRITWNDSTVTQFKDESSARFSIKNGARHILLRKGKLLANVKPQPVDKPLSISTLNSKVTVLGTKFIMKVNEVESMLEVTRGKVEFSKIADESQKVIVREHEYAIVSPGEHLTVIKSSIPVYRSQEVTLETINKEVEIVAEINGSRKLYLVVHNGSDGIGFDHAGWLNPRLEDALGRQFSLLELKWNYADSEWGVTGIGIDAEGEKLTHEGKYYQNGIGTHALSIIEYEIPEGYKMFKAKGVITDSGSLQTDSLSSVVFEVYTEFPQKHFERMMLKRKGK